MKKFGRILTILLVAAVFIGTFAYLFQRSRPKEIQYEELMPEMGTISKSTVVTGKIQFTYGKEERILMPGDSAYYNSVVPHYVGAVDGPAEIYAVLYTPM